MQSRYVLVSSLSAECQFCNILRTCQQRFGRDCNAMRIYFQEPENDMQICFREESKEDTCKEIHVQLYSEGLFFNLELESWLMLAKQNRATSGAPSHARETFVNPLDQKPRLVS
jgi:hypothetical protein